MTRYYEKNKILYATGVVFLIRDKRNGKYYLGAASTEAFLYNSVYQYVKTKQPCNTYYSPYFKEQQHCPLSLAERRAYLRLRVIAYLYYGDDHVEFAKEIRRKHGIDSNPRYYNSLGYKQKEIMAKNKYRLKSWRIVDTSTGFESIIHDLPAYCKTMGWKHKQVIRRANDGFLYKGRFKITKHNRGDE